MCTSWIESFFHLGAILLAIVCLIPLKRNVLLNITVLWHSITWHDFAWGSNSTILTTSFPMIQIPIGMDLLKWFGQVAQSCTLVTEFILWAVLCCLTILKLIIIIIYWCNFLRWCGLLHAYKHSVLPLRWKNDCRNDDFLRDLFNFDCTFRIDFISSNLWSCFTHESTISCLFFLFLHTNSKIKIIQILLFFKL
jgi:hypothetical protein